MKHILAIILLILIAVYCLVWAYLLFRTYKNERSSAQSIFATGSLPDPLPDGFHEGFVAGYTGAWKGKQFDQAKHTGINKFNDQLRSPFKIYTDKGLRDPGLKVMRIDYNVAENPWWLRHLVDEIVQTKSGDYQGKIMVRWIFGSTFTVGYFELKK